MELNLHLHQSVATVVEPSLHVMKIAGMFGLGIDEQKHIAVVPQTDLTLSGGQVVFITGPSGGGKSTLLRLISDAVQAQPPRALLRFDQLPQLPDQPLVDALAAAHQGLSLADITRLLSLAGLGDAFVMLRKPSELSDGQRYRFRLAQTMAICERESHTPLLVVLADEFGATLDRITAQVVARNVRKWVTRSAGKVCFIAATTHDDLLEALEPDVLIEKGLGEQMEVLEKRIANSD